MSLGGDHSFCGNQADKATANLKRHHLKIPTAVLVRLGFLGNVVPHRRYLGSLKCRLRRGDFLMATIEEERMELDFLNPSITENA